MKYLLDKIKLILISDDTSITNNIEGVNEIVDYMHDMVFFVRNNDNLMQRLNEQLKIIDEQINNK